MTTINLLPWREKKREQEKKIYITYLMAGVGFALITFFVIYYYATSLVDIQMTRNQRLKDEITKFEEQIQEISTIRELRKALIARMVIIQNLQETRTLTVRLFDQIVKILPDGVYLNHVERVGNKVTLLGYSESNTNISSLMRNINSNKWIAEPELTEIKKTDETKGYDSNTFKLSFILKAKQNVGSKL
jgi:type IV pilus assembly protein PilN